MSNVEETIKHIHDYLMKKGFPYTSVSVFHRPQDLGFQVIFDTSVKAMVTNEIKEELEVYEFDYTFTMREEVMSNIEKITELFIAEMKEKNMSEFEVISTILSSVDKAIAKAEGTGKPEQRTVICGKGKHIDSVIMVDKDMPVSDVDDTVEIVHKPHPQSLHDKHHGIV